MDLIDQCRAKGDGTPATAATHRNLLQNGVAANGSDPARSFWSLLALSPANWSILEAYAKYPPKSFVGWYLPSGESRNGASGIYPGK
jgi:hypothetical protein